MVRMRSESIELSQLVSAGGAATYLGVPLMTLYQWKFRGKIGAVQAPGRAVLFDRAEIRKLRRELRRKERKQR